MTCGGFRPTDDDIAGDIDRLIKSIVVNSTDDTNVNLQFEEMRGELMLKVAQILNRRDMFFPDRKSFFGCLKTSLIRHKQTHIQRHAFTHKRTGIKHVKKSEPEKFEESAPGVDFMAPVENHKPIKIELDDEETGAANYFGVDSGREHLEELEAINDFINAYLTHQEASVLRQEIEPNADAFTYAYVDYYDNNRSGKFKIRENHKAQGLDMELSLYKKILARVRQKLEPKLKGKRMTESAEDQKVRQAEIQLCEIFNMQVPSRVDPMIKRRAFTIAARVNFDKIKITKDIEALLEIVGAYTPKKYGENLGCFGVLWEAGQRTCGLCAIEESCRERSANVGLGKSDVHLSRKLLGTTMTRTPLILPKIEPVPEEGIPVDASSLIVYTETDRDAEILEFLNESMAPVIYDGEIYYRLPDKGQKRIFCVGQPERIMKLRICNPSDSLKKELTPVGHQFIVPEEMSLDDVKTVMNKHIANQLTK